LTKIEDFKHQLQNQNIQTLCRWITGQSLN